MQSNRRAFLGLAGGAVLTSILGKAALADEFLNGELHPVRYVPPGELEPRYRKQLVRYDSAETIGTVIVDPESYYLYVTLPEGRAIRYGIGVGREGFGWSGEATIQRKQMWPSWHPPKEMLAREPNLPTMMPGGPDNPLGARALYLFQGNRDTLYRLHGTSQVNSIGRSVSSGCIRLLNQDVIDLYRRVPLGTRVVVGGSAATVS
ncbi:lipoprotein-anchoring transpeptidase ErfK/SrfK [Rhodoligotrophos appendicifer]|uniref:L,D-transpeptidase n=1 Tax=Rhodoligotrophos appendicifer TaxID=987056 RepID=UPI0011857DA7|nr:L,D-transpeptidase [Rhodoligotrophos appendicifer]